MPSTQPEASVYQRVVDRVFSGKVVPGSQLVERQLAKEIGISRIPLRESLRKMVGQGMLTTGADGTGIRMREYTPEDLRQLYEFRESLEGSAARAAARAANDADIAQLRMHCERIEEDAKSEDPNQWLDRDPAFHRAVASASHNERIAHSVGNLLTECHFVFYVLPKTARVSSQSELIDPDLKQVLAQEHREIFEHIRNRDADEAEKCIRAHIRRGGARLVEQCVQLSLL